ncbi:SGNH/GDSL hydrolase family protein [Rhizobium sp. BK060]|uniref:SGNH/GDSL hydrolase family protein n=1 Tax=Rhizobium sp. BK060 TaxID=2587096 RepID=UPI001AEDDB61|nr:SGNH/GDSL hydrolase family protein [Rhizobium sp. BK060]
MCFGDSNTYGAVPSLARQGGQRFSYDRRWPGLLARALGPSWDIIEEGHPGRTTVHDDPIEGANKNGLKALSICLESHIPLDLVVLMLGTNDLKHRFSVTAGDIADGIECLVRSIKASQAGNGGASPAILVVAPSPIAEIGRFGEMFTGGAAKSQRLGALIRDAAQRNDVHFMDAGELVESSAIDGIHLDSDAHRVLAGAIATKIGTIF